jgi:hypothetical protein
MLDVAQGAGRRPVLCERIVLYVRFADVTKMAGECRGTARRAPTKGSYAMR